MDILPELTGDLDSAFPQVVDAYQDRLYRFSLRLTGSPHEAEDIAQDALVRAYGWLASHPRALPRLQLRPWLYQVTLNVFRNRRRRREPVTDQLTAAATLAGNEHDGPAAQAERDETRSELLHALAGLPARYRAAVLLRHVEDLSYPEMSAVLRRPEGTLKSDVHRGLRLLRAALTTIPDEVLV